MHAALRQLLAGMLMLPLSVVPFGLYLTRTQEGGLLWGRVRTSVAPPRAPRLSPAERSWARQNAPDFTGAVAALVYHGLGGSDEPEGRFTISTARFGEQLAMLRAAGMHTVTAREVALAHAGLLSLPPNAVMITFDDGRTDAMMYADPIIEALDMRATMFVIVDAASKPGIYYVPWKKLRKYSRTGRWDIESHSANAHREQAVSDGRTLPVLTSVGPGENPSEHARRVRHDLRRASLRIEREIGIPPLTFAYPFGAYGGDDRVNAEVGQSVASATAASYVLAFQQDEQESWTPAICSDDALQLRRLEIGDWTGRELVGRIASSAATLRPACRWGANGLQGMSGFVRGRLRRVAKRLGVRGSREPDADTALMALSGDASGPCSLTGNTCGKIFKPPIPALNVIGPLREPATRLIRPPPLIVPVEKPVVAAPTKPPATAAPAPAPTAAPAPAATAAPRPSLAPTPQPAPQPASGRGRGNDGVPPGQAKKQNP